jgi:hypothetical protein
MSVKLGLSEGITCVKVLRTFETNGELVKGGGEKCNFCSLPGIVRVIYLKSMRLILKMWHV